MSALDLPLETFFFSGFSWPTGPGREDLHGLHYNKYITVHEPETEIA